MQYSHYLIRFAELNTKGKNKNNFILALYRNIRLRLKKHPDLIVTKTHDRIYVNVNGCDESTRFEIESILQEIPGIASFSPVIRCEKEKENILLTSLNIMAMVQGTTFKVRTRRADKRFPFRSDEMNRFVAGEILRNQNWKVDVHRPDIILAIEVRQDACYLYAQVIQGVGGYPLGVGGKALLLLSGGIDSPVAAYEMMKRGVRVDSIHFASPPYTSLQSQNKVLEIAKSLSRFTGSMRVFIVPFTKIQETIFECCDESYAITIMRRMMVRIAEKLANKKHYLALVSGESIGQVASQTLESMRVINRTIQLPMLRPLLTHDKNQIIAVAKKIGTYETSILPYEDCCTIFTPKNPTTKPRIQKAELYESRFDVEGLIKECVDQISFVEVNEDYQFVGDSDHLF